MRKTFTAFRTLSASVDPSHMRGVTIRHNGLNAGLRNATYEHRDHLVVPIIALVEGVLHAVNAENPELVLASEFSVAPAGWGGRPVTWDHPSDTTGRVTANTPKTLERYRVGQVFNPEVDGKKLKMEAWLDSGRDMLPESKDLHLRLSTGDPIEVSVGVFVVAEQKSGEYNGKPYKAIWREIVPDHLAMLPRGAIGACSIADGCGAPRNSRAFFITAGGYEPVEENTTVTKCTKCQKEHDGECEVIAPVQPRSLRERIAALLTVGAKKKSDDLTSEALHNSLELALRSSEPGFLGIDVVNLTSNEVIYAVAPDPDVVQFYQRGYTIGEDNTPTLANKKTEVAPTMSYEPVAASQAEPKTACGCGGNGASHSEGETMKIDQARVKALIAKSKGAFTEADITFLEARSEEQFKALEGAHQEQTVVTPPVVTPPVVTVTPPTEDEWLAAAPASLVDIINRQKAVDQATRAAAVNRLKTCTSFSEAELNAMPLDTLTKLDTSIPKARVIDYSVRDAAANNNDPKFIPPAKDLTASIKAARQKTN
jgi:hypothetical protein